MKSTFETLDQQVEERLQEVRSLEKTQRRLKEVERLKAKQLRVIKEQEKLILGKAARIFPNSQSPLSLVQLLFNRSDFELLDVQKEEYIKLAMQLNEQRKLLTLLNYESEILNRKLVKIEAAKLELNELMQHRADIFNVDVHQELALIVERIDAFNTLVVELIEAIDAAVDLQRVLKQAVNWESKKLRYFKKIDINEVMILELNLSKMRDFRDMAIEIKRRYRILEGELNDILSHSGFLTLKHHKYSDYFIEEFNTALLDDLRIAEGRIHTQSCLNSHLSHTHQILRTMRKDRDSTRRKIKALKRKRDQLIFPK